ncbi:MAG: hypothetical protein WA865_07890 [Spirulinaceae cyanobacterium]
MDWETWGLYIIIAILISYLTIMGIYAIENAKNSLQQEAKLQELESRLKQLEKISQLTEEEPIKTRNDE